MTPENATKWGPLAPAPGSYDWAPADAIVDAAAAQAQAVKGHALVWHQQTPSWVTDAMSADELAAALKAHIEATLAHFRGRMRAWDVVNEAVDTTTASGYRESLFWQKLGPRYIEDAFRWARAADPDVLLFYNDFGIERLGAKSDATYAMLRDLLANGTPIDGIGFQSHLSIHRYPADDDLRANFRRFAELGLRVNVSELDARTLLMPGTQDARWQAQRIAFQQVVGACVVEPACEAITFWGFTDRYSWINADGDPDDPLPFDRSYMPKPATDGILDGLAGLLPKRGDNLVAQRRLRRRRGRLGRERRRAGGGGGRRPRRIRRLRQRTDRRAPRPRRRPRCSSGCQRAVRSSSRHGRGCAAPPAPPSSPS